MLCHLKQKMDNGHVIEGTSICVNYWKKDDDREYVRFLTHLNNDYSCGFESNFEECIHTSPLNAWLITNRIGVDSKYVASLSVDDSHILYDKSTKKNFSVTVVDANHNAGSVMFIFQGDFGNILYTGYFRYNMDMLQHPVLKSIIETKTMDVVYFDNTYAAEHCIFPTKEEACEEILTLVRMHPEHTIIFGIEDFGKEELLFAVAKFLKEQISVSESKLQVLSQKGFQEMFTTDAGSSRIMLLDIKDIKFSSILDLKLQLGPVLTILPSALYYTVLPLSSTQFHEAEAHNIHIVPYSSHSSHSELIEFIHCIKPESVIPIIDATHYRNFSQFLDRFWANIWKNYVVPANMIPVSDNLENMLNFSPPDATVFHSENSNDMVAKNDNIDNELIPAINTFKKHLSFENICFHVETNMSEKRILNSETVECDTLSENIVANHSGHEEIKNSIGMKNGVDNDSICVENNIDCFDTFISSTDDENKSGFSHLDSVNHKCKKDVDTYNIVLSQTCDSAWNNAEKDTNMDYGQSHMDLRNKIIGDKNVLSQLTERCQHFLNNVETKRLRSANVDNIWSSRVAEHCQDSLSTVKSKFKNSIGSVQGLAEHFQNTVDNPKATCDKSTNTDKVSKRVKKNSLPSVGNHCGNPKDLDVELLVKVYEEENRLSGRYKDEYLDKECISHGVTKIKFTDLSGIDLSNVYNISDKYVDKNGQVKIVVKKYSDPSSSFLLTESNGQTLATPEIFKNRKGTAAAHKRKLMDSVFYNKMKQNKVSNTLCVCKRNDDDDDDDDDSLCSIKRRK